MEGSVEKGGGKGGKEEKGKVEARRVEGEAGREERQVGWREGHEGWNYGLEGWRERGRVRRGKEVAGGKGGERREKGSAEWERGEGGREGKGGERE